MDSEHSEDLLVVKELKKEKYYPGHGRYFLRKRELKKQQKKQIKNKKWCLKKVWRLLFEENYLRLRKN